MKNHLFLLLLETTSYNTLDSQVTQQSQKECEGRTQPNILALVLTGHMTLADHSACYFESINFKWMKFRSELHDGILNHITWALTNAIRQYWCSVCHLYICSWINKCCPTQEKMTENTCEYRIRQLLLWQQMTSDSQWHVITATFHFPESFTLHCRFTKHTAIDIIIQKTFTWKRMNLDTNLTLYTKI